jgi:transglutaminase-like putative cysteine protease
VSQTLTPPQQAEPPRGPSGARRRPRVRRPTGGRRASSRSATLFAAEVALTLVTAAAVVGMHRLFSDGSYRPALLAQAVLAHATVALLRRARVALPLAALATVAIAFLALTWGHYLDTTTLFLPTGETLGAMGDDLSSSWAQFQDVQAPAPVSAGFLLAAGAAVWLMVFVADWAAFRAAATFEALLPSATLFLFAAALGAPGGRVPGAALYAAAAMLFVLVRRTLEQESTAAWAATHRSRGRWSLLGTGLVLVGVAVAAGTLAGPQLPGADSDAVIAWRDIGDGAAPRIVVSPMVDIQSRMIDQPDVELFRVRSPEPAYWRLTSLDSFDGSIWKSSYGTSDADGELGQAVEPGVAIREVGQTFDISALAQVWLPAAYEPMAIDTGDGEVDWDERSSTLIVDKQESSSDGLRYEVTSDIPNWTDDDLRTAPATVPDGIAERYLQLPDLDPRVEQLALELTAGAQNPFDKAMALQSHLKAFEYDLRVPAGHSGDALATFLFDTQRGYCEQFAGSFAAMARSIGLPARVAVGFTQGIRTPDDPTLYQVRGEHAHAWVEVYLDGFGWVPFDPTPGRAPPRAQEWLGLTPQQDETGGDGQTATEAPQPTTTAPPAGSDQPAEAPGDTRPMLADDGALGPADDGGGGSPLGEAFVTLVTWVALASAAYLVLVPLALLAQRTQRRRQATTPAAQVQLAWSDAVERADASGIPLPPSLTVGESAERMRHDLADATPAIDHLAGLVERTVYAEVAPSPDDAVSAVHARDEVVAAADRHLPARRRLLRHVDIRELWRRRSPAQRRRSARPGAVATMGR